MSRSLAILAISATCFTGVAAVPPASADPVLSFKQLKAKTDHYLFEVSLGRFVEIRSGRPYVKQLDWSSDACSKSPDSPRGYDFKPSCHRHDFGYRNYKKQDRFSSSARKRIDENFKDDMYSVCAKYSGLSAWKGVECRRIADGYYAAVRRFGSRAPAVR